MITHRVHQLNGFDHIIVIDNGKVIERGSHEMLMANKSVYYELYERQKMEAEEA